MIPRYIDDLISKYATKAVLVDTNLLLLYFMGEFDVAQIARFKRTRQFTTKDFHLIKKMLSFFKPIITTPNIMTEVSNLAGQLPEPLKSGFLERLGDRIEILSEEYSPSAEACGQPHFRKYGLTDTVILLMARNQYLVITEDFKLAGLISNLGLDVINFNHIRQSYLLGGSS